MRDAISKFATLLWGQRMPAPIAEGGRADLWVQLLDETRNNAPLLHSPLHGERHWRAVAWAGFLLAEEDIRIDPEVVLAFGMIHDSQRLDECFDPEHGARASGFARRMQTLPRLLNPLQIKTLVYACHSHEKGRVSDEPTIGACWTADRLNLWRVGIRPRMDLLSATQAPGGLQRLIEQFSHAHSTPPLWEKLIGKVCTLKGL